jgi:zinc protease
MNQRNFRFQPIDEARLKLVDLNRAFKIYQDRFSDANGWTFVLVGNFKPEEIKPLIEMYLGGLPAAGKKETYRDLGINPPKGIVEKKVFKGSEPKSAVRLVFTGPFEYSRSNRNQVIALQKLVDIKLRETLREDMSGVYGVGVSPSLKHFPRSSYQFSISFGCSPDNVEKLIAASFKVIDSIKQNGCSPEDLTKVKEILLKEREVNLKQNNFWLTALLQSDINGENILELQDYNKQIQSLTTEDLKRLASQYFTKDNYATFILYPLQQ